MRNRVLPVILCALAQTLMAQSPAQLTQENGDCTGAIPIADSVYHQPEAVRGFGNRLEVKENPMDHPQWFEREHHTTWYKFRSPATTTLTFDIIPDDPRDDIDFLLLEGAVPGICDKIAARQVQPLRSNISRNDPALGSRCGLSRTATEAYVRSGVGASYSSAIEVKEGDLFYLVVDYQHRPLDGYTIHFHYDPPPRPVVEEASGQAQELVINITDARSGQPVDAAVTIDGLVFDKVVEAKGSSSYRYSMEMYRNLRISCLRQGYMFANMKVKGSMDPTVTVDLKLVPIAAGEHVVLEDIRFVGNEDQVMRSSHASLVLLLRFLEQNPRVRIEVEGHVNGPTYRNTKEFIELSTSRARAVRDYLLVNDVEPERVSYVGLGNSRMLFPQPKNKEQSEANRRVEVKVVSN